MTATVFSRRTALTALALAPAVAALPGLPGAPGPARATLRLDRSVNTGLTAGRDLFVSDAQNVLWAFPADGGEGRRLTTDGADATLPHLSPDGSTVVFQSFAGGSFSIAAVPVAGGAVRRLTEGEQYDQEPRWSPDGRRVVYVSDAGRRTRVLAVDAAGGPPSVLVEPADGQTLRQPTFTPDGRAVAYVVDDTRIERCDLATGERRTLVTAADGEVLRGPSFSAGGRLAHVAVRGVHAELVADGRDRTSGADVAPLPPAWRDERRVLVNDGGAVVEHTLGGPARTVPAAVVVDVPAAPAPAGPPPSTGDRIRGMVGPAVSPDGTRVAFRALDALWVREPDGTARRITDDRYFASDPDWSPDGTRLVHSCDRSGVPNLWVHDLRTGRDERLTGMPGCQVRPRWSPDGRRIAYQDEDGATWVLALADFSVRRVLEPSPDPGRPGWCPWSESVAVAVTVPHAGRDVVGYNEIATAHLPTGRIAVRPVAAGRSVATRGDDGPVWTPDGRHLLVNVESRLCRVPVTRAGDPTGPPEPLGEDVADGVSVARDGTVVHLSAGVLRRRSPDGTVSTLDTDVRRPSAVVAAQPWVLRVGGLWDGTRPSGPCDVVVDGTRIAGVRPPSGPLGRADVDASGLTAMPGLIDTHVHWWMRGRQWGNRQGRLWLSYGVTTSRSTGDPAYDMVENREATDGGHRVGPRYVGTGEGFDGTRVHFAFMRPVHDAAQLDRELRRATDLDYAFLKAYMALPLDLVDRVVGAAAGLGARVGSHSLYPAVAQGLHGMEHTGGGNRLGYSRTLTYAGGRTAQDTVDLLAASGMWVSTTTLFASEALLGDGSLVHDRRTRTLFPAWEYESLLQRQASARAGNPVDVAWTAGDVDLLRRVHRAGGTVVAGTDAPLDAVGISMHHNLRALVAHGFTPAEALSTATVNAARAVGLESRIGRIAPGFTADLALVEGDPVADIRAAAAVRAVLRDGRRHTVDELLAPYRGREHGGAAGSLELPRVAGGSSRPSPPRPCCRAGH